MKWRDRRRVDVARWLCLGILFGILIGLLLLCGHNEGWYVLW